LKANEWLTEVLKPFGGRGGGRANMAQGSVALKSSNGESNYDSMLKTINEYLLSKSV
jgi:alanyl-tRNA synthetase